MWKVSLESVVTTTTPMIMIHDCICIELLNSYERLGVTFAKSLVQGVEELITSEEFLFFYYFLGVFTTITVECLYFSGKT